MKCWCGLMVLLMACSGSPYPGFTEAEHGVYVRLHRLGDGTTLASDSDSVHVRTRISHLGEAPGTLFSTERTYSARSLREGCMREVLGRMHEGDSMSLITPASLVPFQVLGPDPGIRFVDPGVVQVEVAVLSIITPTMMRARAEEARRNDPAGYERRLIQAFIAASDRSWVQWGTSDLYYSLEEMPTDTQAVGKGEMVTVTYSGRRLEDGVLVDDTQRQGGSFSWRYGDPDQVMNGLEVAVQLLRMGGEGEFILPSLYAFGTRGVPGLVEPNTPMIYRVSLQHVERRTVDRS